MSAKKRSTKSGWKQIADESYILETGKYNSDVDSSFGEVCSPKEKQPSISNGVFYGEVVLKQIRDIKVPETFSKSLVEINAQTMQLCGLHISGPVVVHYAGMVDSNNCAYRSWPSTQVALGKVAMSSQQMIDLNCSVGDFVFISSFREPIVASSIFLELHSLCPKSKDNGFISSKHFVNFLSQVLNKTYFVEGQQVSTSYFGKPFVFKVNTSDNGANGNADVDNRTELEGSITSASLNNSMKNLAINDVSDKSDANAFATTSTPLKNTNCNRNSSVQTTNSVFLENSFQEKVFVITSKTVIQIKSDSKSSSEDGEFKSKFSFNDIGGLHKQKEILTDVVIYPMKHPRQFLTAGVKPVRGVLLCGPPGTGKSMLAKSVAGELNSSMVVVRGTEIMSRYFGESEKQLHSVFNEARKRSPCIVVMDDVESLCPRRDSTRTDVEKRLVASFISILDVLNSWTEEVVVIATTNRLEAVDPALRRSGRFDREVDVGIPSSSDRAEILGKLLEGMQHNISASEMDKLADQAHGYVGADLHAVCGEAGLSAVKHCADDGDVIITADDVVHGLKQVPPSAMRELIVQVPKVKWSDIGGNSFVKKKLKHAIEWPLKNPAAFQRLGIDPPRGVLMYGPPGCSKTLTAKALATESGLNFISIKGPELFSKYVGDSERSIREIFAKARSAAPAIIFFDELDALAIERGSGNAVADRVLAAMLTEMDGVEQRHDVIVVAATNRPDMIDKALLRPGRIDKIILVPLPDAETRREIFRIQFRKMPIADDVNLDELVAETERYSGAEICSICREAALEALEEDFDCSHVTRKHFSFALRSVIPQTSDEKAKMYQEYERTLQKSIR